MISTAETASEWVALEAGNTTRERTLLRKCKQKQPVYSLLDRDYMKQTMHHGLIYTCFILYADIAELITTTIVHW